MRTIWSVNENWKTFFALQRSEPRSRRRTIQEKRTTNKVYLNTILKFIKFTKDRRNSRTSPSTSLQIMVLSKKPTVFTLGFEAVLSISSLEVSRKGRFCWISVAGFNRGKKLLANSVRELRDFTVETASAILHRLALEQLTAFSPWKDARSPTIITQCNNSTRAANGVTLTVWKTGRQPHAHGKKPLSIETAETKFYLETDSKQKN